MQFQVCPKKQHTFESMVWLSWLSDCYRPWITLIAILFPAFVFAEKAKTKVVNYPVQIQPRYIRKRES